MLKIYDDDAAQALPKDCINALNQIFKRVDEGRVNPYNIYGKCYNFDDKDLNSTRMLESAEYSPKGFSVKDYAPWSIFKIGE